MCARQRLSGISLGTCGTHAWPNRSALHVNVRVRVRVRVAHSRARARPHARRKLYKNAFNGPFPEGITVLTRLVLLYAPAAVQSNLVPRQRPIRFGVRQRVVAQGH